MNSVSRTVVVAICIGWAAVSAPYLRSGHLGESHIPMADWNLGVIRPTIFRCRQVFGATYSIGLLFLRRQFAQERLGWHVPSTVPLPLPIIAPAVRASNSEHSVQRRAAVSESPMADDGTHDIFSEPWAREVEVPGGEVGDSTPPAAEMRQVQLVPVSLSAFR